MSVYTAAQPQIGQQPLLQQPYGYGQQTPWQMGQQTPWQAPFGGQQPYAQYGQMPGQQLGQQFGQFPMGQQFGSQPFGLQQLPQIVTELALRCAATALSAITEQLRFDPQAVMGIQAQGQIPPHVYSNVLVECARRIAPVLATTLAPIVQGQLGQGGLGGQPLGQPFGPGQQMPQSYGMSQAYPQFGFSALTGAGI